MIVHKANFTQMEEHFAQMSMTHYLNLALFA